MVKETMKITKEVYNKAMENEGRIPKALELEVFGDSLIYGYGVYGNKVRMTEDGEYVVDYKRGSTCD